MTSIIDFVIEMFERITRFLGLDMLFARRDPFDEPRRSGLRTMLRWLRPVVVVVMIAYTGALIYRFTFYRGMELSYPAAVLAASAAVPAQAAAGGADDSGAATGRTCKRSALIDMQAALIDMVVNQNDWVPATPQYKIGVFGLIEWSDTPWFDNKAALQLGILDVVRRVSLDLADTLGRVRGTSGADADLQGAQSRLRVDAKAWVFNNPFDAQLPTMTTSAASSYRGAIKLYRRYNDRLGACDALYDIRADNLRTALDRIAADIGSTTVQLQRRAAARVYDVAVHDFVPGDGNNRGWFDFKADNIFHRARGQLFALHGLMQAARLDFAEVVAQRNLGDVWDRMEQHIAEGAALNPLIVSNGREDGIFAPDHLSVMAEKVLRARANMVELREILDR